MTDFRIVYDQFLSSGKYDFNDLTPEEIEKELFNWTVLAISKFKFPFISLDYISYTSENPGPDGETSAQFINDITQREITVIVEYMKLHQIQTVMNDARRYDLYYEDANLKLPSQSAVLTQLNRAFENQKRVAFETERNYEKALDYKPTIGNIWN